MKVLIISSRYLPHKGGLETVVKELSRELEKLGHAVSIITNRYPRNLPSTEIIDGISVRRLFFLYPTIEQILHKRFLLWLMSACIFPFTTVRLITAILAERPDVVNLHYVGNPTVFTLIAHRVLRFPLIVSLHGGDVDAEPHKNRLNRWLFKSALQHAKQITACSQHLLSQALTIAPEHATKAHVIHNGVHAQLFQKVEPYKCPAPYIFAVGQLAHHKGFDLLIDAFSSITVEFPHVHLLIAGEGPEKDKLLVKITDLKLVNKIELIGGIDSLQVAGMMRGSQLIVVPSRREPFGIVALEAVASGRPVIVSKIGGLIEAVDRASVTYFESDNLPDLVDCLRRNMAPIEENLSNQEFAQARDWSNVARAYLAVMQCD